MEDEKQKCEVCGQWFKEMGMHRCFESKYGHPYEYYEESIPKGIKVLYKGKFTNYLSNKNWEYIARKNNESVVSCIATYRSKLILVKQFRKPVNKYVIEFPAGVIDKNETLEQTIIRELKEETGFTGVIEEMIPAMSKSPGITNELIYMAIMHCANPVEKQNLQDDEQIEVILLDLANDDIELFIKKQQEADVIFDSNVRLYLQCKMWGMNI
jgi:8-oxo-dGTP pyrophosphatase MutT (NUDIX family)